jgi:hypothetical protein
VSDTTEVRPVDSGLERRRLLCVLGEAVEKLSRLDKILKSQQVFIKAQGAAEGSASALDTLGTFLDRHKVTFLESSDLVAAALKGSSLNQAQEIGVLAAIEILITGVRKVHELLLLLPREAAKPQASFLLRDCFGREDLHASIVLTNFLSAYEYRFEDILKKINVEQEEREHLKQGGNVLCQAFADRENPLAWAVLAHEYGHCLDEEHAISQGIRPGDGLDSAVVAETVADFVAAHVLGPASLLPILFLEMMQPQLKKLERISAGHPPTPLRVQLVRDYLRGLGVSTADFEQEFRAYEHDYARKLQRMDDGGKSVGAAGQEAASFLVPLAGQISSKVNSLGLRRFEERNSTSAKLLRETLSRRQPISSRRLRSEPDIFKALSSLTSGKTTPDQAYEALAGLDEVPVPGSEILTAGWMYKLASFEGKLLETFPGGGKADLGVYADYVDKVDDWLLKSLELAAVHAEVLRRLDTV